VAQRNLSSKGSRTLTQKHASIDCAHAVRVSAVDEAAAVSAIANESQQSSMSAINIAYSVVRAAPKVNSAAPNRWLRQRANGAGESGLVAGSVAESGSGYF
jgi:hypothetical protein